MSVLMIGCDKGAWQMRGRQLGGAMRATCITKPKVEHWNSRGSIVLVKRAPLTWYRELKQVRGSLVWDVLDFWHQPSENAKTEAELVRDVLSVRNGLKISTLIGATQAMAKAIGGIYLPHHSRLGLSPTPSRAQMRVVAYDGSPRFLGSWKGALERACARLGLTFVINPLDLATVDLLVAFRGEEWDGFASRQWKSGIKYVNAIAAGRPVLTQSTAAFEEIRPPGGKAIEDQVDLEDAIAAFRPAELRQQVFEKCRKRRREFALETIAAQYRAILQEAHV